jgi:hypothetical protein
MSASVRPDVTLHALPDAAAVPQTAGGTLDLTPLLVQGVMPSAEAPHLPPPQRARRAAGRCDHRRLGQYRRRRREGVPASGRQDRWSSESADDFSAGDIGPLPEHLAHLAEVPYVLSMGSTRSHKDLPALISALRSSLKSDLRLVLSVGAWIHRGRAGDRPLIVDRVSGTAASPTPSCARSMRTRPYSPSVAVRGFRPAAARGGGDGPPVVASNSSSLPRLSTMGILIPPADPRAAKAIERVLRDSHLREQLIGGRDSPGRPAHVGSSSRGTIASTGGSRHMRRGRSPRSSSSRQTPVTILEASRTAGLKSWRSSRVSAPTFAFCA